MFMNKPPTPQTVSAMSDNELRVKVAELCGWTITPFTADDGLQDIAILPPGVRFEDEGAIWHYAGTDLPDYLADLNAMHEAERAVILKDVKLYMRFATKISAIVGGDIDALFATARQRAEAFVLVMSENKEKE